MPQTILVVDDDIPLTNTIASLLQSAGYAVATAYTAEDGLELVHTHRPDLAVLDIMVPVQGGLALCRHIRTFSAMPLIFLSALGDIDHVVRGLELGADDYMVKPFQPPELLARIKAHLRRSTLPAAAANTLSFGDGELVVDLLGRRVLVRDSEVSLTAREFELLLALIKTPGRVRTATDLLREAWDIDQQEAADNIKPYIHYLRKKIERDPAAPRWILTVRGAGYRFAGNAWL